MTQSSNQVRLRYVTDARPAQHCCRRLDLDSGHCKAFPSYPVLPLRRIKTPQIEPAGSSASTSAPPRPLTDCRPTDARSGESENKLCYPPAPIRATQVPLPVVEERWIMYREAVAGRELSTTQWWWILIFISSTMKEISRRTGALGVLRGYGYLLGPLQAACGTRKLNHC